MAIKRIVDTSFWQDAVVVDRYTVEDKYFLLYLMTNPHTKQCGIYLLPRKYIAFEMGYSLEVIKSLITRFQNTFKNIVYSEKTQEIAVLNAMKYNIVKGGKPVEDCIKKDIETVMDSSLIFAVYQNMDEFWETSTRKIDMSVKEIFKTEIKRRNTNDNDNDNDNELSYPLTYSDTYHDSSDDSTVEQARPHVSPIHKDVIDYLNAKTGKQYRFTTKKTQDLIRARQAEGFELKDFQTVVDKKVAEWTGTEFEKFLRPETLFGTKFEGYLNQSTNPKPKRAGDFTVSAESERKINEQIQENELLRNMTFLEKNEYFRRKQEAANGR